MCQNPPWKYHPRDFHWKNKEVCWYSTQSIYGSVEHPWNHTKFDGTVKGWGGNIICEAFVTWGLIVVCVAIACGHTILTVRMKPVGCISKLPFCSLLSNYFMNYKWVWVDFSLQLITVSSHDHDQNSRTHMAHAGIPTAGGRNHWWIEVNSVKKDEVLLRKVGAAQIALDSLN